MLPQSPASPKAPHHPAWVEHAVRQIQAGRDVDTHFRRLFDVYEPRCRHFFARRGQAADADDLVQEVMLRVHRGLKAFRLDSSFDTWILVIMNHVAQNHLRHQRTDKAKAARTSLDELLSVGLDHAPAFSEPPSDAASPLDQALAAEREAQLTAAFNALPARMRRSLLLHHRGYKLREIADLQGVSVETVKKQVQEGRKRLLHSRDQAPSIPPGSR